MMETQAQKSYFDPAQPAILIAPSRSGSVFLSHCLDSHYQIGCERGEPFNPRFPWQKLGVPHRDLALALWRRRGYRVTMFKVSYRQFRNGFVTLDLLLEFRPKVIHLHRMNVLEAIISAQLTTLSVAGKTDHPMHTYEPVAQRELELNCSTLIDQIKAYRGKVELMRMVLAEFDVLELEYETITKGSTAQLPRSVAGMTCDFLDVDRRPMGAELARLNPNPIITNRAEVEETLAGTPYGWML
jgi:hypothetical protein